MNHTRLIVVACALAALSACGARTSLGTGETSSSSGCASLAPACVVAASDPCGASSVAPPSCDASTKRWSCPSVSRVYERATDAPSVCLPFHDDALSVGGSIVRVPTDDGRCLWIAEDVRWSDGTSARNVAFTIDPSAPFGTCPSKSATPPTPIVTLAGDDPSILVQINQGYRLAGRTHVLYRLFKLDSSSAFGVTDIGGGVAHWDAQSQRIVVPPPTELAWGTDLDLGDAFLVQNDTALVWGCPGPPHFLTEGCLLRQLDGNDSIAQVSSQSFDSGPWLSSVIATTSGLLHVYAVGFGSDLQTHTATSTSGPWSPGGDLAHCDLPSADPKAFCAGPVVHEEIDDPTRPGEWVVSYGIGSTGVRTSNPDDYWTRLVWVK